MRDLDAAKRSLGRLGLEVADAVVIEGEQFLSVDEASHGLFAGLRAGLAAMRGRPLRKSGSHRGVDVRVNDQWRICFVCREADAYDVEITDYP